MNEWVELVLENSREVAGRVVAAKVSRSDARRAGVPKADLSDLRRRRFSGTGWRLTMQNGRRYATKRGPDGSTSYLHRLVSRVGLGVRVKFRNGDPLDCRRPNLESRDDVPRSQGGIRYRGVTEDKGRGARRFRARLDHEGKSRYLGRFETAEEAAERYDEEARKMGLEVPANIGG